MTQQDRQEFAEKLLRNCNVTIHQFNIGDGHQIFYQKKDGNGNLCYALVEAEDVKVAETPAQTTKNEVVYANHIFIKGNKYINANLARLRDDIGSCISGVLLSDESRYDLSRPQIDSSKKNQWYYIFKMLRESGLLNPGVSDAKIVDQMMLWYPEVFESFGDEEQTKAFRTAMCHSVSAERKNWTCQDKEVPFCEMNTTWQLLNINYNKKFMPMFSVCKELKRLLDDFKTRKSDNVSE